MTTTTHYDNVLVTPLRHRLANECGVVLDVPASRLCVRVSFSGSLASMDVSGGSVHHSTYMVSIRYYNTRRPSEGETLISTRVSVPCPLTSTSPLFFVPVSLSAVATLPCGVYKFDVYILPLAPTHTCGYATALPEGEDYNACASGTLSMDVVRK
jgi:hypothetical protein